MDTSDIQREQDEVDFDAWVDSHAPEHYEPDWEPVESF